MGSKYHIQQVTYLLLIAVAVVGAMCSCFPPKMHLHFADRSGFTRELKLELHDGTMEMKVSSFSTVTCVPPSTQCDSYVLSLGIEVKLRRTSDSVRLVPRAIRVFAGDSAMTATGPRELLWEVTRPNKKGVFEASARFRLMTSNYPREAFGALPVEIIMDSVVWLNGEPVAIDAIRAVEKQRCSCFR